MKQNFKLTKDQQTLVEKNLSIVHWVIVNNIHVNPGICGLEYGDLFQEGCLWLCKAAFTYHAGQAQFSTYAKKVVKKRLKSDLFRIDEIRSTDTLYVCTVDDFLKVAHPVEM